MTRRLDAGPLLVTLGAVLLLVSLFLYWFEGDVTAWQAFEVWDVVLLVLAIGGIVIGVGLVVPDAEVIDRRWLPFGVGAVAVIVASQIVDPPPAVSGRNADVGAWLALGSALIMCVGAVLTFGRVHLALMVEGRDPRHHFSAVDARGEPDATTDSHAAVAAEAAAKPAAERAAARAAKPAAERAAKPAAERAAQRAADRAAEAPDDPPGDDGPPKRLFARATRPSDDAPATPEPEPTEPVSAAPAAAEEPTAGNRPRRKKQS